MAQKIIWSKRDFLLPKGFGRPKGCPEAQKGLLWPKRIYVDQKVSGAQTGNVQMGFSVPKRVNIAQKVLLAKGVRAQK